MTRHLRWTLALGALSLAAACGAPDEGPWMKPGQNCMQCHSKGGEAEGKTWTAAGTVYMKDPKSSDPSKLIAAENAKIVITDATGRVITLTSNGAGNFYTGEDLKEPLQKASVFFNGTQTDMPTAPSGSCNSCHGQSTAQPLAVP